eukprot:Trichotokara_eunicae@DN11131_c0_g1_i1.p1
MAEQPILKDIRNIKDQEKAENVLPKTKRVSFSNTVAEYPPPPPDSYAAPYGQETSQQVAPWGGAPMSGYGQGQVTRSLPQPMQTVTVGQNNGPNQVEKKKKKKKKK